MKLQYDFEIDIATAHTRTAKSWKNRHWQWSELIDRCRETKRTSETMAEYAKMSREEQSNIKDVGGFVGGYLSGGVRKNNAVLYRSVATLDIDYGNLNIWDDFTMTFSFAAMLYSTHKHSKEHPRYRLVFPLSRQVTPAEYEPLCRKIAAELGIDLFDDTTYELPRLFYWPSTSKDADYVFEFQDGVACDVDSVLNQYVDYKDVSSWPLSSRADKAIVHEIKKAEDPTEKQGLIGAFCRTYTIEDVLEQFLQDYYTPTAMRGRYTYKLGSVAGGLVCYEHKYAFSHHDTDPASRRLCNAFDLVRIHLFGAKDEGSRTNDSSRLPSFSAMQDFVAKDSSVRLLLARERQEAAADDFGDVELPADYSDKWKAGLEFDKRGNILSTIANTELILENDPAFAGHLTHDTFAGIDAVVGGLPWDKKATEWTDRDDANLRGYLEKVYGLAGKDKIYDALTAVLTRHSYHPIRNYLNSLHWDGVQRLDKLIIDYIGAEDNELNRQMTRKHFTAAVARVFVPGCKYDYCLIMSGPEGAGKSTLLSIMGGSWFNDSIVTTEGKEGMEQLRRAWIIEMGELSSIKRSDVESVKAYLSKSVDKYREAYGRRTTEHPRQCIFCGTTNETLFLKGNTGNRRFWVIPVDPMLRRYDNWQEAINEDRDQLWAEAVHYFRSGEKLYLGDQLEAEARQRQSDFNDDSDDPVISLLYSYLDTKLPENWDTLSKEDRRRHIKSPDPLTATPISRNVVSVPEFMYEVMGLDMTNKDYKYTARKIAAALRKMPNWEEKGVSRHAEQAYGRQKSFCRVRDINNDLEEDL